MSSSSRPTSRLAVMFVSLLFPSVFSEKPLFHICSSTDGKFETNEPYENNLKNLITALLNHEAPITGFALGSVGQHQEEALGLVQCRGDASQTACRSCVAEAVEEIKRSCPGNKGALIWYDNCQVKYSSSNFFGKIDYQNKFYMYNLVNVSDPVAFNVETKTLLTKLVGEAVANRKLFATGQTDIVEQSKKLYGMMQCTRDLNPETCKTCLDGIIGELPKCCDGREGGRVVGGSCNLRYEIYPFVTTA